VKPCKQSSRSFSVILSPAPVRLNLVLATEHALIILYHNYQETAVVSGSATSDQHMSDSDIEKAEVVAEEILWAQCDSCQKWRKLPFGTVVIENAPWY
jgi:CW-type Zinc Finger